MNLKYKSFRIGKVVATPGALAAMADTNTDYVLLLARHLKGDWGNLGTEDKHANDEATKHGNRILSCYLLTDTVKLYIITEADRSSTTILLASEY